MLFDVGEFSFPVQSGVEFSFPHPQEPQSVLIGTPHLTDPSSVVRVLSFVNNNFLGPITNDGFMLNTYNDAVDFKLSWETDCPDNDFLIGFYTSQDFEFGITNHLYLICGNKGPSLFNKKNGSFKCSSIGLFYIAINKDTKVKLTVNVIIPQKKSFPILSETEIYTKCIRVKHYCSEIELPVYSMKLERKSDGDLVGRKWPSKLFYPAWKAIDAYLNATSLSITLFQEENINVNPQLSLNKEFINVPSITKPFFENAIVYTDTNGYPDDRESWMLGTGYCGFKISSIIQYPFISYTITVNIPDASVANGCTVKLEWKGYSDGLPYPHIKVSPVTKIPSGNASAIYKLVAGENVLEGDFILQRGQPDFFISVLSYLKTDSTYTLPSKPIPTSFTRITINYIF